MPPKWWFVALHLYAGPATEGKGAGPETHGTPGSVRVNHSLISCAQFLSGWNRTACPSGAAASPRMTLVTGYLPRRGVFSTVVSVGPECAAVACLLALIWWGIWSTLDRQHADALNGAARDTANLARAFEENTRRTVASADQILLALRSAYRRDPAGFDVRDWLKTETAPDWLTAQIAVIGPDGMSVASTASAQRVSVADREHFIAQRDSADDTLLISKPVLGRSSGRWSIQLTRKILSADGAFAGIVVVSLDCYQLSGFYESLNLQDGYIALVGLDGVIRARGPMLANAIGSTMTSAEAGPDFLSPRPSTNRVRSRGSLTVSHRRLDTYPLVVTVAFADRPILAGYRQVRRDLLCSGACLSTVLLILGGMWIRVRKRSIAYKEALALTLESMNQGLVMVDPNERVRVVNPRALELLGLPAGMLSALRSARAGKPTPSEQHVLDALRQELASQGPRPKRDEARGRVLECHSSTVRGGGAVHVITDVTARCAADDRIRHMALHDSLTGLGNRALFNEALDYALEQAGGSGEPFAVLSLGLNDCKRVNDMLGQELGEQVLAAAAARLQAALGAQDLLTRSGSDEFLVLSRFAIESDRVQSTAATITQAFEQPFVVAGQQLHLGVSIGVATYPEHGATRAELVRSADLALFAAIADRTGPRTFEPIMAERVQDRLQLEQELRAALDSDELYLEYQPQFRAASLEVVGFEALARWRHPTRGNIRPDVFIPLAEETGIVIPMGRKILEAACRTALQWPERIRIGVNLSPVQFRDPDLLATISDVLSRTGLPASRLELEVTEGVLIADEAQALRTLSALRQLGVGLALDDFGTGYASLSYLRKFPFERIKLDRSFVQAQVLEDRSRHILQSILGLSRKLGVGVIAEGVETRTQLHLLRQQGCQDIQGFLVGKPLPASDTARMISPAPSETAPRRSPTQLKPGSGTEWNGTFATVAR